MSYWQEKQSIKWTTVIGNGKRMARKWRQQAVMGEKDIIDYTGRERTVYAPGISENGMILMNENMVATMGGKQRYDLSLQPDEICTIKMPYKFTGTIPSSH